MSMPGVSLKRVYQHLQQMPPPHHSPLEHLLHWTQKYQGVGGHPVFVHLQIPPSDPLWQHLSSQYHSQDILCDATAQEMWVRACCHWGNLVIGDESLSLSAARWKTLNPLQTKHYLEIYHRQTQRQKALQKMRARQQRQNTE